jgi:hypothetical protein
MLRIIKDVIIHDICLLERSSFPCHAPRLRPAEDLAYGWISRKWSTSAAPLIARQTRARSSAGDTRPPAYPPTQARNPGEPGTNCPMVDLMDESAQGFRPRRKHTVALTTEQFYHARFD